MVDDNPTNTALTSDDLNAAYPSVYNGFRAQCLSIGKVYEKTASGWVEYSITSVP